MKTLNILGLIFFFLITACKSHEGNAPSTAADGLFDSFAINPSAIIVPKSSTFRISLVGTQSATGATGDVLAASRCTTSNPMLTIDALGNLTNTYTGTAVQRVTMTCTYLGMTKTADVTIVPATLTSLILTKTSLQMGPNQTQSIQVYGNFTDINSYVFALEMTNYITWSSNNSGVSQALVGTVSSGSNGSANITASFGAISVTTSVTVSSATTIPTAAPRGPGLLGSYYDFGVADPASVPWNSGTIGDPFERLFGQRIDSQVYFDWSTGINNLGQPYYFGIRWTGRIYIPTTGNYTFYTQTDDGVRLWINDVNGVPVINNWTLHASTENTSGPITLTGGQFYDIKMEYFENAGYSVAQLSWQGPSITKALIPQIYLFPN